MLLRCFRVMVVMDSLNPLARRVWTALVAEYPQWADYLSTCGENDLEVVVPAPLGSKAGHLVVFTSRGEDLWIRFSPPRMCYSIDDERELLAIIQQLQADMALFVVTMRGEEWVETTLIGPQDQPLLEVNQTAHVVSWSGKHDRTVVA